MFNVLVFVSLMIVVLLRRLSVHLSGFRQIVPHSPTNALQWCCPVEMCLWRSSLRLLAHPWAVGESVHTKEDGEGQYEIVVVGSLRWVGQHEPVVTSATAEPSHVQVAGRQRARYPEDVLWIKVLDHYISFARQVDTLGMLFFMGLGKDRCLAFRVGGNLVSDVWGHLSFGHQRFTFRARARGWWRRTDRLSLPGSATFRIGWSRQGSGTIRERIRAGLGVRLPRQPLIYTRKKKWRPPSWSARLQERLTRIRIAVTKELFIHSWVVGWISGYTERSGLSRTDHQVIRSWRTWTLFRSAREFLRNYP